MRSLVLSNKAKYFVVALTLLYVSVALSGCFLLDLLSNTLNWLVRNDGHYETITIDPSHPENPLDADCVPGGHECHVHGTGSSGLIR